MKQEEVTINLGNGFPQHINLILMYQSNIMVNSTLWEVKKEAAFHVALGYTSLEATSFDMRSVCLATCH